MTHHPRRTKSPFDSPLPQQRISKIIGFSMPDRAISQPNVGLPNGFFRKATESA
jgi:hypothetical protein